MRAECQGWRSLGADLGNQSLGFADAAHSIMIALMADIESLRGVHLSSRKRCTAELALGSEKLACQQVV